jgi:gluconokinase
MVSHPDIVGLDASCAPYVLSLDIGTSGTRAAIYDGLGREVLGSAVLSPRSFTLTADGGAETDADELAAHTDSVLSKSVAIAGVTIDAVALATFWHGMLGVDAAGLPVTPIYGWADTRAWREADELREQFDEPTIHHRTGCRFHAGYWPAKLIWLRAKQPELYAKVAKWISPGDHLLLRWSGQAKTSVSMASATGLFDQDRCAWDRGLLGAVGVNRSTLSDLEDDAEVLRFSAESVKAWPKLADARIFPAIGDGAANNVGIGCLSPDRAGLMIGTSGAMRVTWAGAPPDDVPSGLWLYRVDRNRMVVGGALSDGGSLYSWMRETIALPRNELDLKLDRMTPDAHGLTVLPFWAGERSTGWNSSARGGMLGLTINTKPIEVLRAAMEAVALRFAVIAEQLDQVVPLATIHGSGGAVRESNAWGRILADALGRPLQVVAAREATRRGVALLALERLGASPELEKAEPEIAQTFTPNLRNHDIYVVARERQQRLRDHLFGPEF